MNSSTPAEAAIFRLVEAAFAPEIYALPDAERRKSNLVIWANENGDRPKDGNYIVLQSITGPSDFGLPQESTEYLSGPDQLDMTESQLSRIVVQVTVWGEDAAGKIGRGLGRLSTPALRELKKSSNLGIVSKGSPRDVAERDSIGEWPGRSVDLTFEVEASAVERIDYVKTVVLNGTPVAV